MSILITSTARSDMRLASSWMVIVSGMITSRAIFSFCSTWRWPVRRWLRRRNDATERVRSSSPEVAAVTVRRPRRFSSPGAALGALSTVAGLAATPGRRMTRAPSSSSMVAGRAATGAAERVLGFAVVGSGATGGAGRAMWLRLCGRPPTVPPPERGPPKPVRGPAPAAGRTRTAIAGGTLAAAGAGGLRRAATGGPEARPTRRRDGHGLLAETATGLVLGDALALVLVAAALLVLALARFGGLAFLRLGGFALGAAAGLFLLRSAVLLLATARIRQGVGAGIPFLVGEGAQHDAGAGRIRGRTAAPAATLRRDLGHSRSRGGRLWRRSLVLDGSAGGDGATLDGLDHHRFRAAMGEALAHHALLDRALQRQRLGRHVESLVARVFRIIHSAQILRVA